MNIVGFGFKNYLEWVKGGSFWAGSLVLSVQGAGYGFRGAGCGVLKSNIDS
jgi:hypothetical protein